MTFQLYFWIKPFLRQVLPVQFAVEKDMGQLYTPVWPQAQSPILICTWKSRSCPLRWKPRQEVWLLSPQIYLTTFPFLLIVLKLRVCFWACSIFLLLLFLVSRIDLKTAPPFFSNNFSSLHKRQVYAFWIIPEIPYSATQWEKSNSASITWCRCNQKRGQWKETLNYLNPCLL